MEVGGVVQGCCWLGNELDDDLLSFCLFLIRLRRFFELG